MKLVYYVSIITCLFLTSCEREIDSLENEEAFTKNIEIKLNKDGSSINNSTRGNTRLTTAEIFRNKMEWASFITAKVLYNSNSLKIDVKGLINNQTIPLEDLIGINSQLPTFHNEFVIHLTEFITSTHCPENDEEGPDKSVIKDDNKPTSQIIDEYLDYMLNQNCVELYFPIDILSGYEDIISLSHPLTTYYANHAYQRQSGCISTKMTHVTPTHIFANQNNYTYIVARPIRGFMLGDCSYTQYSGIIFTQFLQGPF